MPGCGVSLVGPGAVTLDVGCGPGHISAFLASNGLSISGVDVSPAMVALARSSFPHIGFRVGPMADLPIGDSEVEAVVSKHSIIHTEPDSLEEVFSEFARVLAPKRHLFVSFFAADDARGHGQPFDHAVCTAYQFDPSTVSALLASHGPTEQVRLVRQPRSTERPLSHATLFSCHNGVSALRTSLNR